MAYAAQAAPTIDPEEILSAALKAKAAKAKPKSRPRSFDPTRRVKADPRDPRTKTSQWPCYNKHTPGPPQSNPWGQWVKCQCCNLRLLYTPRKGAPANSTESLNHPTVKKMLDDLHVLLGETRPTAQVCHYMMQKLTAEAVLNKAVTELLSGTGTMNPTTATTKAPGSSSTPALATPSSASWEALQDEELIQAYENEADAY